MQWIDWTIVAGLMLVLTIAALRTRKYTRSVSAFLAANRCGGRYLICVATNMAQVGVISLVWFFEMNYEVGYAGLWWPMAEGPALIIIAISGWVVYRYRQTRAMTLAQFFEMRYSKRFRIFAGIVAYVSGIINFGIFPAIGARFFIALCGLPPHFEMLGLEIGTFSALMVLLLGTSLVFTFLGGQIAVMVTDFLQGAFANIVFAVVILYLLLYAFRWEQISEVLLQPAAGKSLINPLDMGKQEHFNFWFFMIGVAGLFYGVLAWQGTQGYNCAAKNAHEAKMANLLAGWRNRVLLLVVLVVPICVRTVMQHDDFTDTGAQVQAALADLTAEHDAALAGQLETQLRTPAALGRILPVGLLGAWCAAMLAAFISTHDTYLHSWGSIFVQDVILPLRKKPLSPRQHLWMLRASIFGVAAFIFIFSQFYRPTQYVSMFLIITGAIYVGGAGAVIIGGLYTRWGTTAGAWTAMLTGSLIATVSVVIKQVPEEGFADFVTSAGFFGPALDLVRNRITGQELNFIAICSAVGLYVVVSLLTSRQPFNLDRMLHRGKYAIEGDESVSLAECTTFWEKLGFTREFTGRDKIVAYITLAWPLVWTGIFLVGTAYALWRAGAGEDIARETWIKFWWAYTWFTLACSIAVSIWFVVGGFKDLRYLFKSLRSQAADVTDDGRVEHDDSDEGGFVERIEPTDSASPPERLA